MKTKNIRAGVVLVLLSVLFITSCSKCNSTVKPSCGTANTAIVAGTAYVSNYYTGAKVPADSQMVYIRVQGDPTNTVIAIDQTDSLGHFAFYNLDTCSTYIIYSYGFIANSPSFNAPYYGDTSIKPVLYKIDSITLTNTIWNGNITGANSGVAYYGINITTVNSGTIGNVNIYAYLSDSAAIFDSTMTGAGSIPLSFTTTDSYGKALVVFSQMQPPITQIYINAQITIGSTKIGLNNDTLQVSSSAFLSDTLHLHSK